MDSTGQIVRCMGKKSASTKVHGVELKKILADAGECIRYSNEFIGVIVHDLNEALCAIDEIRSDSDNVYCQLHTYDDKN